MDTQGESYWKSCAGVPSVSRQAALGCPASAHLLIYRRSIRPCHFRERSISGASAFLISSGLRPRTALQTSTHTTATQCPSLPLNQARVSGKQWEGHGARSLSRGTRRSTTRPPASMHVSGNPGGLAHTSTRKTIHHPGVLLVLLAAPAWGESPACPAAIMD